MFNGKELKSSITATDIEDARKIFYKNHINGCEIIGVDEDDSYLES
jgi:hypothetical protein